MKARHRLLAAAALLGAAIAQATPAASAPVATAGDATHASHATHAATAAPAEAAWTHGEVRRWDAATGRVTLRHGEITNLRMAPMTMVFRLQDPATPAQPEGTAVRFQAVSVRGALVLTRIEPALP